MLCHLFIDELFPEPHSLEWFTGFYFLSNCSVFILLVAIAAIARTVGHLNKSAEVMKLVNNLMKAPEVAATMQEFSKEMTKVPFLIYV